MKKITPVSGLFVLTVFIIFTILVNFNLFKSIDWEVTLYLQAILPRILDMPFSTFSLFGSAEIVLVLLLILRFVYKKLNIIYVLLGFIIFHIIELTSKAFLQHLGPPRELVRYFFQFSFPSSGVKPGYSYPSGHVGRTMFISTIILIIIWDNKSLTIRTKQIFSAAVVIFDLLMLVSRVYLGEHWLSDVSGGALLGVSVALLVFSVPNYFAKR